MPLERPRLTAPRLGRWLSHWITWLAWAGILGMTLADRPDRRDCATTANASPAGVAAVVCEREYRRTGDPATGIHLANSLRRNRNIIAAKEIARGLQETSARGDALRILGDIAREEGQLGDAIIKLEAARELHRVAHQPANLARDDQRLSAVLDDQHRFGEALLVLEECIASSQEAGDDAFEHYCHLSTATVLSHAGHFEPAVREFDRAEQVAAATEHDRTWLEIERGDLHQRKGLNEQAVEFFKRARAHNERAQIQGLGLTIELDIATSLADLGKIAEAEQHFAAAQMLNIDHEEDARVMQLAARIAYRRGDLALAWSLNERAFQPPREGERDDDDDMLDVAVMQARIALERGDPASAETWAKRGIDMAERFRSAQFALELRPWTLAARREPYELWFVALARAGRFQDAMLALGRWQGRTVLDAMVQTGSHTPLNLHSAAHRAETLGRWLPAIAHAPFAQPLDPHAVIETLRTTDVLALVIADQHVWRATANRGQLEIRDLGAQTALRDRIALFSDKPTDRALGDELGALLLNDESARPTGAALHVLLDGTLAQLPIAALRVHGRPVIAVRPVVRVATLPETPCRPVAPTGRATVIGDAGHDLSGARLEAEQSAALLGTASITGAAATADALFAAMTDSVLHIAVHGDIDRGGGALKFYDRDVTAAEIAAHGRAPSLAVLSACVSGQSNDPELAGSVATAFLIAGSQQVVATSTAVDDKEARSVMIAFYRSGGVSDPVRALARVQARFADTSNTVWPHFSVFGHETCAAAQQ
jgi:tetratricopeptide (TPR) repeat protein